MNDKYRIEQGQRTVNECGFWFKVVAKETGEVVFKCDTAQELKKYLN